MLIFVLQSNVFRLFPAVVGCGCGEYGVLATGPTSSIEKGERLFQQRADDEVQRRHHGRGGPSSSLSSPASEARTGGPSSSPPWPGRMRGGERTRGFVLRLGTSPFLRVRIRILLDTTTVASRTFFFPHARRDASAAGNSLTHTANT